MTEQEPDESMEPAAEMDEMDPKDEAKLVEAIARRLEPIITDMKAGLLNAIQEIKIEVAGQGKRIEEAEIEAAKRNKSSNGHGYATGTKVAHPDPLSPEQLNLAWDRALEKMYYAQEAAKAKISPEQERAAVKLFGQEFVDRIYKGIDPQPADQGQGQKWDNGEPKVELVDHYFRPPKGANEKRQAYQAGKAATEAAAAAEQKRVIDGQKTWHIGHS